MTQNETSKVQSDGNLHSQNEHMRDCIVQNSGERRQKMKLGQTTRIKSQETDCQLAQQKTRN
jgi:hypothetical protein